jgi:hypothetical protein
MTKSAMPGCSMISRRFLASQAAFWGVMPWTTVDVLSQWLIIGRMQHPRWITFLHCSLRISHIFERVAPARAPSWISGLVVSNSISRPGGGSIYTKEGYRPQFRWHNNDGHEVHFPNILGMQRETLYGQIGCHSGHGLCLVPQP